MGDGRNLLLIDYYKMFGIDKNASISTIESKLERYEQMAIKNHDTRQYQLVLEAREYLLNHRTEFDNYLRSAGVKFPASSAEERKTKRKLVRGVITTGVIVALGIGVITAGANFINKTKETDNLNNVCVEYQVQEGDTKTGLNKTFADYGFSYLEASGADRDPNKIYEDDIVIGRTTKENADRLVEQGSARIISIDEAVALLKENHSLIGEFRAYDSERSDMVFYVPTGRSIG